MKKINKLILLVIIMFLFTITANAETLNCKYTYRQGSRGDNVKVLQKLLNDKVGCGLVEDGIFGAKTKTCVKVYQKNNGLGVDGIVGKMTCSSLNNSVEEQKVLDNPVKYLVSRSAVNFRQGPSTSTKSYGMLAIGTEVNVIEYTNSNWYKVTYNKKIGYIHSNYLIEKLEKPLASNEYVILGSTVNVRKGPSTAYGKITSLKRGTKVKVTGSSGNWYKVLINNRTGYIRNDLISNKLIIVDVSDQMLYFYEGEKNILMTEVVTGQFGRHDTPLGNYTLYTYNKQTDRYLDGYNDDGTPYHSYVNYWMPFNGGVGFHDATWRTSSEFTKTRYKEKGSHGCVNMKLSAARILYENTKTHTAIKVQQ